MPSEARKAALRCLLRIEKGAYSNLALRQELDRSGLDQRDAAFCTALVQGTVSRQNTIDALLAPYLKKNVDSLDSEVRAALRIGAYQLKWMDSVPDRAAVNECVELVKECGKRSAAGLVNAVLRKCADCDLQSVIDKAGSAVKYSVCDGLANILAYDYGEKSEDILRAFFRPSDTYFRVNISKTTETDVLEALSAAGVCCSPTELSACIRVEGSIAECRELMDKGYIRVQSKASQFAAHCVQAQPGEHILDMCAAPGGKTLCMAQDMRLTGRITACDLYESRVRLIRKQAEAEGIGIIDTMYGDASLMQFPEMFDRILCDAPCSGYGEIASKPELRYKDPSVSAELPLLQRALLDNAVRYLKKGGRLVYSTCTILHRENSDLIRSFLSDRDDMIPVLIPDELEGAVSTAEGMQLLPSDFNSEGFFISVLEKR